MTFCDDEHSDVGQDPVVKEEFVILIMVLSEQSDNIALELRNRGKNGLHETKIEKYVISRWYKGKRQVD